MISDPTVGDTGRIVRVHCVREHVCPRRHWSVGDREEDADEFLHHESCHSR